MLLNVHSYFSLRYGTLSLEDLIEGMLTNGYDTAVLTDIHNSSGFLDFLKLGQKAGLNILAGMEFREDNKLSFIGIAKNDSGFKELNELMTRLNKIGPRYKKTDNYDLLHSSPRKEDFNRISEQKFDGVDFYKPFNETSKKEWRGRINSLQAPEFSNVYVIYPYGLKKITDLRDNEYIGIRPNQLNKIAFSDKRDRQRYVILAPITFHPTDYKLHRQLRAIDNNILISQLDEDDFAPQDETFISRGELMQQYRDFPELIANTNKLLEECSFDFDFTTIKNKKNFTDNRYNDLELLRKYTLDGLQHRYSKSDDVARDRIKSELEIIDNLNFSSYFLITDDICRYARHRNFHYVGRGSGANSAVAYCLGITDVDPITLKLPFERFLNPKRKSPPDFDVDFSWDQRDEMYDYIFNRYQTGHTALMGAMSTFRSRSILRELGKVYGLPKAEIDRLVHEPEHMLNKNEVTNTILSVYNRMADFPNQRTIHASGVLISEEPLTCYSALDYPPKGLPTVQFDMYVAEDIGFEKFDILSQRGIGHIKDCRAIVKQNKGIDIDTSNPKRFFKDPKIADQLRSANTIGCFYIESPAMRQLIIKLQCDDYLTLVAASSIIRPGVASSGMMGEFIERHRNPSFVTYLHPVFKEQLEETYGVMVYQEDVMKIANAYGGLDMADADVLRRMMSGKYRSKDHLIEIENKYFSNCKDKGHPENVSREIWRQMESFAGYSFNKAHSASYAVESYQSLFLKTYFPIEFMVAVLNNYGGFYSRKVYVNEARKAGANICLPCVNKSIFNTTVYGSDIYLGFDALQNLERSLALLIAEERIKNGEYSGIENFAKRTGASLEQIIILIRVGAFNFLGIGKKELLWEAHLLLSQKVREKVPVYSLFESDTKKPKLPIFESSVLEDLYDEIELIGFVVSAPAFELAKSTYRGNAFAADLWQHEGKVVRVVGDYVTEKNVKTKRGDYMKFGTFLDERGDFIDTVHFSQSLARYPLRGMGLYLIEGKVVVEYGCPAIEVYKCGKMPLKPDPRSE